MFKFLFGKRGAEPEVVVETQRQTFERLVSELNEAIGALPEKPAVTVDPATGHVTLQTPEQFPDEALALPEPEPEPEPTPEPEPEVEVEAEAETRGEAEPAESDAEDTEKREEKETKLAS